MAELSFLFVSVRSDKPRPVTRLADTYSRGAPGAGGFVCLAFKTGPQGRFLNGLPLDFGCEASVIDSSVFFDCHAPVRPFAVLSRFKDLLPRFASPARGHFLLRQKVTKERPGAGPWTRGTGQRLRPWADDPRGRLISPTVWRSVVGSTLIYYQRIPTDGARRLGCAGILDLCSRLPASGLLRPEARWPD